MTKSIQDFISALSLPNNLSTLTEIGRGIERESLRVLSEGRLSTHSHYNSLGSALTHPQITTDYSETLMEFITPVSYTPELAITQLEDVHKFVLSQIDDELLWPMSMPCFVKDANKIELANYGNSNIGKMKRVYRQGLKNRYGSMMQVIAGIHFNFSLPKSFWQVIQEVEGNQAPLNDFISQRYFALIRNYKRFCWLIPYLYGSSPAICPSFLQGKKTALPFKTSANGYMYLPYATSLRMSDLGYTNSEQSALYICYNNIESYIAQVEKAISLSSEEFSKIGIKVDGQYQQLNSNVLQIENELYAPIRPKRVAESGEKPSQALKRRGVEYIEVRALDVNPFSQTGITTEQVLFLDVFLTYCALLPSPELACEQQQEFDNNMDAVVNQGRDPALLLSDFGVEKSIPHWGNEIFAEMKAIAQLLDQANQSNKYLVALESELSKINDAKLTPSAKIVDLIVEQNVSLTGYALTQAQTYKSNLLNQPYQFFDENYFIETAKQSHLAQAEIEKNDTLTFDEFLADYFTH
ncbi:glutamate--cysteine ligase [Thalassotalea agariperforans]